MKNKFPDMPKAPCGFSNTAPIYKPELLDALRSFSKRQPFWKKHSIALGCLVIFAAYVLMQHLDAKSTQACNAPAPHSPVISATV